MVNAWQQHLKNFRKQNSHLSFKQLLTEARKSYQGGGDVLGLEGKGLASRAMTLRGGSGVVGHTPMSMANNAGLVGKEAPLKGGRSRRRTRRKQSRRRR
jgi:hypothetical protein